MSAVIDKLSHDGRGIISVEGKKVFVDGVLPGEEISWTYTKRHKRYDEAKVQDVIVPSADRVPAPCTSFLICGGCSYQHMSSASQLREKQKIVQELLLHFGENITPNQWLPPLTSPSTGYRTKARLGVRYVIKKQKLLIGFREKSTNYLTEMNDCSVLHPSLNALLLPLNQLIMQLSIYDQIPQIEFAMGDTDTRDNIVVILRIMKELSSSDYQYLNNFIKKHEITLLLQPKGIDSIYKLIADKIDELDKSDNFNKTITDLTYSFKYQNINLTYFFQPHDFTQVNLGLNQCMLKQAIEILELAGNEVVLDLFCGIGNFTLPFAKILSKGKVIGIEGSEKMVEKAYKNARFNQINNVNFFCANLYDESFLVNLSNDAGESSWLNNKYNCIILDPPRSGAKELLPYIAKIGADKVLYISCDPATFARDVGILCNQHGYILDKVGIMDMFPHTKHVETMGLLIKNK